MDILNLMTDEVDDIFKTIDWGASNNVEVDTATKQSLHPDENMIFLRFVYIHTINKIK